MAEEKKTRGYGEGKTDTVVSVDEVLKESEKIKAKVSNENLLSLSNNSKFLEINGLQAGYGKMQILHNFNLFVGKGQSLCLIGPNGAGKSTVLHSIYGFTDVYDGDVIIEDKNVTTLTPADKLKNAGVAYILQDNSVFPDMTVEENLLMGGFIKDNVEESKAAAEEVLKKYTRLNERRNQKAKNLSGGERRLLEISRALIMNPEILLVDEPSIGLEPKFIDMVFEILGDLQKNEGKTIIMVEQNAKKGLEFADIGYVLVSGETVMADTGDRLLANPEVGKLFLGG
ncbi:MAG: ABC transporter ATP-binding protein [Proteobacteria bacterium]|jgi:branched-chain amino acid transport system ATP-binding protein|nr:ABC transporter ATP-binding protein [Pseudomonadota bacterium]MDA0995479.1 ABC transporter ATP-binding protein [Pseudomonadota bacterium]